MSLSFCHMISWLNIRHGKCHPYIVQSYHFSISKWTDKNKWNWSHYQFILARPCISQFHFIEGPREISLVKRGTNPILITQLPLHESHYAQSQSLWLSGQRQCLIVSNHNIPHVEIYGDFRSKDILTLLLWESLMTLIHVVISLRVSPVYIFLHYILMGLICISIQIIISWLSNKPHTRFNSLSFPQ